MTKDSQTTEEALSELKKFINDVHGHVMPRDAAKYHFQCESAIGAVKILEDCIKEFDERPHYG